MNVRCTICDAVVSALPTEVRCPECGARGIFRLPTVEALRHARGSSSAARCEWEFSPDGAVLRRFG